MEEVKSRNVHPVDEMLPVGHLFAFGLQHVLAMYAGAVAVPIILAGALHLTTAQLIQLINADLFTCGIATLIQTIGFRGVGAKVPMIQGVTFAAVSPMIIIGTDFGLTGIYGSIIIAGLVTFLMAGSFSKLIRFFPPVVTGTIITIIGTTLMPVAVRWISGPNPKAADYASMERILLAAVTMLFVILIYRFGKGFTKNIAVLIALILGTIVAYATGMANFGEVAKASWFDVVTPFAFGYPEFYPSAIFSMIIVMLVVMVETTGDLIAIGEIVDKKVDQGLLARCLRADGLSTAIGGVLNSFPYTAFAQNVGLVAVTGIRSRFVVAMSGVILIVLGLFPKLAAVVACIPQPVLGGAGVAMFGMIIASGIRSLAKVEFEGTYNLMVIAISFGFGLITLAVPNFYHAFPEWFRVIMHSGITAASVCAVLLNVLFNGVPADEKKIQDSE